MVGQGSSDYGVNFTNGNKGGEYTHTISKEELPSFSFSGTTNWVDLQGSFNSRNPATHGKNGGYSVNSPTGIVSNISGYHRDDGNADSNTSGYTAHINASHQHTFNISFNGSNKQFTTISPYLVVYMWKRTA